MEEPTLKLPCMCTGCSLVVGLTGHAAARRWSDEQGTSSWRVLFYLLHGGLDPCDAFLRLCAHWRCVSVQTDDVSDEERMQKQPIWFMKSDALDSEIRGAFADLIEQGKAGKLDFWEDTPLGTAALVILFDQFTRNTYRNSPDAFSAVCNGAASLTRRTPSAVLFQTLRLLRPLNLMLATAGLLLQELCSSTARSPWVRLQFSF